MIRRPRSAAIPLVLTVLTLVGLTLHVARFGEHVTIQIVSPAGTDPPQVVHEGETIHIEAIVDSADAVYKAIDRIGLGITDESVGIRGWASMMPLRRLVKNYDKTTKRFAHDFQVAARGRERYLSIDVMVIDKAGRNYGSAREPAAPANLVLLRVEPAVQGRFPLNSAKGLSRGSRERPSR
ncbi:MAG TPA: hypothetical protein VFF52_23770 [Isosphaeraceae bacterium]|nr:hypothetical protein [Isosphaeraceae bacterium]